MRKISTLDWRVPSSPPWIALSLRGKTEYSPSPFSPSAAIQEMFSPSADRVDRRRSPQGAQLKADKGKGVQRVPSLEELDQYGAGSSGVGRGGGGGFKKDFEYQKSKELDPMEYAWLIQQGFVSSIRYTRRMKTNKKSTTSMESLNIASTANRSKNKNGSRGNDLSSLQHLDLATGWESSRHVLVEEVISNVLLRAQKSSDLSRLQHLGLPPRYLPTIAEAIQAEHLAEFKHLDLANTGSLGKKSLELRRLVESRLPTFLRSDILPYRYSSREM